MPLCLQLLPSIWATPERYPNSLESHVWAGVTRNHFDITFWILRFILFFVDRRPTNCYENQPVNWSVADVKNHRTGRCYSFLCSGRTASRRTKHKSTHQTRHQDFFNPFTGCSLMNSHWQCSSRVWGYATVHPTRASLQSAGGWVSRSGNLMGVRLRGKNPLTSQRGRTGVSDVKWRIKQCLNLCECPKLGITMLTWHFKCTCSKI